MLIRVITTYKGEMSPRKDKLPWGERDGLEGLSHSPATTGGHILGMAKGGVSEWVSLA